MTCECNLCEPDEIFQCVSCLGWFAYCQGGDGDELCNDCWSNEENNESPIDQKSIRELYERQVFTAEELSQL